MNEMRQRYIVSALLGVWLSFGSSEANEIKCGSVQGTTTYCAPGKSCKRTDYPSCLSVYSVNSGSTIIFSNYIFQGMKANQSNDGVIMLNNQVTMEPCGK